MLMKTNHNKWHIVNNFVRHFGILCSVSFDMLHINCLHICILIDIIDIDIKCYMFGNLLDHILHINFLKVYNNY